MVRLIFIVVKEIFGNQTKKVPQRKTGGHLHNDVKFFFCLNLILPVVKESEEETLETRKSFRSNC